MKVTNANGVEACLIFCHADLQFKIRVYKSPDSFIDYDILHDDLWFKINDLDASFYSDGDDHRIDHSPDTLGVDNAQE